MGIRLAEIVLHAKEAFQRQSLFSSARRRSSRFDVPKGHFALYVGEEEEKKRFVVPISYLKDPEFQCLLALAEAEFGFNPQVGGLKIPCSETNFVDLTSRLNNG